MKREELLRASAILSSYSDRRRLQELRILENEEWYRMRNYDGLAYSRSGRAYKRNRDSVTSGYLFHAIEGKHQDAMDNVPSAYIRAQEPGDEIRARVLSEVLPEIIKRSGFKKAYSYNWHEKPKHGTGVYFVGVDKKINDTYEVSVKYTDLLRIYWQPGIEDIQDSENVFCLEFMSRSRLIGQYPDVDWGDTDIDLAPPFDPPRYIDEELNNPDGVTNTYSNPDPKYAGVTELVCVIDWYYKKWVDGVEVLHLCKYAGNVELFSSEGTEGYKNGFYEDGKYPFVFDVMFREKGSPAGFGLIAIGKQAQRYIDRLDGNLLEQALLNSRPQMLISEDLGIDIKKMADKSNQFIPFTGRITAEQLHEFRSSEPSGQVMVMRQEKIGEIKELTNNRDFGSGGTANGVTAASAISLLQASGNKASRDFIQESWNAFEQICEMILSRVKQFYTSTRVFRIAGKRAERLAREVLGRELASNEPLSIEFDAKQIFYDTEGKSPFGDTAATSDGGMGGVGGVGGGNAPVEIEKLRDWLIPREVLYDIELDAQNTNPLNEIQDNQTIFNLLDRGLLNPGNEQMLLTVLDVITIGKKDELIAYAEAGLEKTKQQQQMMEMMQAMTGGAMGAGGGAGAAAGATPVAENAAGSSGVNSTTDATGVLNAMQGTPQVQAAAEMGSNVFAG